MSVPYEKIVEEDLNLGSGEVEVTMPGGGTATGHKIGPHTFSARAFAVAALSSQSIDSTVAVVEVDTEELDTDGWFDAATYTFQPTQAGVYLIQGQVSFQSLTGIASAYIYRGLGEVAKQDAQRTAAVATVQVTALVSLNGDDDTITLRANHTNDAARNVTSATLTGILINKLDV